MYLKDIQHFSIEKTVFKIAKVLENVHQPAVWLMLAMLHWCS